MGRTACTESQCLYKGARYLTFYLIIRLPGSLYASHIKILKYLAAFHKKSYQICAIGGHILLLSICSAVSGICFVFDKLRIQWQSANRTELALY